MREEKEQMQRKVQSIYRKIRKQNQKDDLSTSPIETLIVTIFLFVFIMLGWISTWETFQP